jgi:predicted adenylyl cyclase CyaB
LGSNVEIKARVDDVVALEGRVARLADGAPETIGQRDTFFRTTSGRLKLREFADGSGELILYERPDATGPTTSHYVIAPTSEPGSLRALLGQLFEVRAVVNKERRLYMRGHTRIHVDRVEDLGNFVELEVVLQEHQTPDDGRLIAEELMQLLCVAPEHLVEVAYVDLLERKESR